MQWGSTEPTEYRLPDLYLGEAYNPDLEGGGVKQIFPEEGKCKLRHASFREKLELQKHLLSYLCHSLDRFHVAFIEMVNP